MNPALSLLEDVVERHSDIARPWNNSAQIWDAQASLLNAHRVLAMRSVGINNRIEQRQERQRTGHDLRAIALCHEDTPRQGDLWSSQADSSRLTERVPHREGQLLEFLDVVLQLICTEGRRCCPQQRITNINDLLFFSFHC